MVKLAIKIGIKIAFFLFLIDIKASPNQYQSTPKAKNSHRLNALFIRIIHFCDLIFYH